MPTINVRLFAGLRETIGAREITVTLNGGATVEDLCVRIGEEHPLVRPLLKTAVAAVDEEYVPASHELHDGDMVALIPPVSGG
jgi:molybdopterin synthase sulfur carrier subunit